MPQDWEKIYNEAVYAVFWQNREIRFGVGEASSEIDEILTGQNARTFAFLTAYNPFSTQLSDAENKRRQAALINLLKTEKYEFLNGYGTNEDESWQREESLFILNISEENALKIARRFEQHAILFGEKSTQINLVWAL